MSRNPDTAKVTPLDAVSMSEKKRCTWKRCCILWCCFACALAIFVAITVRSVSQLGMSGAQCSYCKPHIVMPGSTRIALNGQSASFRSVLSNNSNASYVVPLSSDCAAVVIQESRYPNLCMLTLQLHVVYGDPSVFAHVGGRTTASADNSNAFAVFSQPARLRYLSMSKNSVVLTEDMKLSCISDLNAFGECLFFVTVESSQSKSADVAVTVMVVPYWTASESPSPTVSDTASISHSQSRTTSPTRSSGTSKAPKQCFAFAYTGSYQFFTVPVDATSLMVTLWGGGGGVGDQNTAHGGAGAYLTGTLTGVNGGDRLRLIIGCGGCMGGQDARGGGGTSLWSWTDASLAQGGGRTAVQLCRQKPCGNLNVSSTTGWLDHVTAGGGGAGNGSLEYAWLNLMRELRRTQPSSPFFLLQATTGDMRPGWALRREDMTAPSLRLPHKVVQEAEPHKRSRALHTNLKAMDYFCGVATGLLAVEVDIGEELVESPVLA